MIPRPIPVAAPTRVASRLAAAADGPRRVLHASGTAIYVDLDGWALGLAGASATRVPCALWSTVPDLGVLEPRVDVRDGALVVGDHVVRVTRLADPRVARVGRHEDVRSGPGFPLTSGLDLPGLDLPGRHLADADLDRLVGRGPGLTPLGDDVLAGWFTARAALGRPDDALAEGVRRRLGATTLLSATLLDCAIRGEALPQLTRWLGEPSAASAEALLAVGATSGAGLMAGAAMAIDSCTTHRPTHRPRRAA